MKDVTRPDDLNRYYMYKDQFITRYRHNGLYVCYTPDGKVSADTQRGIKQLISEAIKTADFFTNHS